MLASDRSWAAFMRIRVLGSETMSVSEEPRSAPPGDRESSGRDVAECVRAVVGDLVDAPLAPGLYLVATPIGNLADITLRALSVLARADVIYCEDTRHSARLLKHYAIGARTRSLHEHNEDRETGRVLADLEAGKRVAVISDAGTPLVSDPGFRLVRAAVAAGALVFSIPGPSAALAALTTSAMPTDAFFFAGFLPAKQAARRSRLSELAQVPGSLVFFEAPHRVGETLADMADVLGDRSAVVARELTKLHEDIMRGRLAHLAKETAAEALKGEIVIVIGPEEAGPVRDETISARLDEALRLMSFKDAAKVVAEEFNVPKARVYGLGLKARKNEDDTGDETP